MLLDTPIESLPATSSVTIHRFKALGINTYFDLLNYFPFRYEDYSLITPIARIQEGEVMTVKGMIVQSKNEITKRGFRLQKSLYRMSLPVSPLPGLISPILCTS